MWDSVKSTSAFRSPTNNTKTFTQDCIVRTSYSSFAATVTAFHNLFSVAVQVIAKLMYTLQARGQQFWLRYATCSSVACKGRPLPTPPASLILRTLQLCARSGRSCPKLTSMCLFFPNMLSLFISCTGLNQSFRKNASMSQSRYEIFFLELLFWANNNCRKMRLGADTVWLATTSSLNASRLSWRF
jgi:hypothetical protein